jgi:hypothetical protein
MIGFAAAAALGALAAFLFDPTTGKRRRHMAADRTMALFRRSAGRAERLGRAAGAEAYGVTQKAIHEGPWSRGSEGSEPDDVTLARMVESEAFRGMDVDAGRINVSAENGVVVLVGVVDRPEQIERIEAAARAVSGVKGVDNLLHLHGTPAPTKRHMIEAR